MIDLWYKNAIIYSLDVETFADSNGDGIGDFSGLTHKLDYLSGLNVNCLWLLPFYPSPNRDNGYDVTDYYGVDSRLGTLGDFVEFTHQAHERGIRILIDLVVNHTSIDHHWFQAARADRKSPYHDYYIWSEEKPSGAHEGMVFPGEQDSTWTWDEQAQLWYFHRFYNHQPDLNVANPLVREEISKIMGFWLQLGVSGFRMDAAPFVIEMIEHGDTFEGRYEYLLEFRNYLSWRRGDAVMLAEANVSPEKVPEYFGSRGDKLQMLFNFLVNQCLFLAMARRDASPIRAAYASLPDIPEMGQWANFLRTHDELDLGRLTEEERSFVYSQFAPEESMRIYDRGIRRRLAPMLGNDRRRLELAYSLMLTLPGTPVLRYGDEIGMGDDLSLDERNSVRTPMQWSNSPNGGFSSAPPDQVIHPVVDDGEYGWQHVNVEAQERDPESLLNWMTRVLRVRRHCYAFGWGRTEFLETGDPALLAHRCTRDGDAMICIHNLDDSDKEFTLDLPDGHRLDDVLTKSPHPPAPDGRFHCELGPYGYRWFREHKENS